MGTNIRHICQSSELKIDSVNYIYAYNQYESVVFAKALRTRIEYKGNVYSNEIQSAPTTNRCDNNTVISTCSVSKKKVAH